MEVPYTWKTSKVVFVNSMSGDMFHKDIPFDFIKDVFRVMNAKKQMLHSSLNNGVEKIKKRQDDF